MKKTKIPEWEQNEPAFNPLAYDESILKSLSYYSLEVDSKTKQDWAIEYYNNQELDTKGLDKLTPMFFDQAGILVRLMKRGVDISQSHKSYLITKYNTLKQIVPIPTKKVVEKVETPVEKSWANADKLLNQIDDDIDALILNAYEPKIINIKLLINELNLKKDDFEYIKAYCNKQIKTFTEILTDSGELKEAYNNTSKRSLKQAVAHLESIISLCGISKVLRDKKVRVKSPNLIVKSLQYQIKDESLNIVSIDPAKIVNASEVWLFDTEKRKLSKYKADEGNKLTVKGTTILNWSFELSSQKTVRKPEEIVKQFTILNKTEVKKLYDSIKSVDMAVKGRTNKNQLLLRVF